MADGAVAYGLAASAHLHLRQQQGLAKVVLLTNHFGDYKIWHAVPGQCQLRAEKLFRPDPHKDTTSDAPTA